LAQSTLATLALVSNHYFARNTGYFDEPAEQQVLLHTWSLSVEEQFYLLWPLLLLLLCRLAMNRQWDRRRTLIASLATMAGCSLLASILLTPSSPSFAFFSLPTRAWEFAFGAMASLALVDCRERPRLGSWLTGVGWIGIAASGLWISADSGFPGSLATLPVLATVAVLAGGSLAPGGWPTRCLRWQPLVAIGLVSYGWYLWHWPLLALARIGRLGELSALEAVAVCALALLVAALSYRLVEKPLRRPGPAAPALRVGLLAIGATALLAASSGAWAKWWWPSRGDNSNLRASLIGMEKVRVPCGQTRPYATLNDPAQCTFPPADGADVVLWGDSHAAHFLPGLQAARPDLTIRVRYMPECPPILDYSPSLVGIERSVGCEQFNADVLAEIRQNPPVHIILAARWRAYVSNPSAQTSARAGLTRLASELATDKLQPWVLLPPPEFAQAAPACLARRPSSQCEVERDTALFQRSDSVALLASVFEPSTLIDPYDWLCPERVCAVLLQGELLYSDAHHLSVAGSRRVGSGIAERLR
jgi:peptidoglycan/LPS O-acetylase OafA/YrhL